MKLRRALVALSAVVLAGCGGIGTPSESPTGTVHAEGPAHIETGTAYSGTFADANGTIDVHATDAGGRVTPLPPHDQLTITSRVDAAGHTYEVRVTMPAVEDPLGRFTTWWGVGLYVEHHGRSGIGTDKIPAVRSKLAAFGIGDVLIDGKAAAQGVLVHFMTMDDDSVELDTGDGVALPIDGLPNGHLRLQWDHAVISVPTTIHDARYVAGGLALIVAVVAMFVIAGTRVPATARTR